MNDLLRWFERTAVDRAFRELATTDPERSFEGFALAADEREVLARQDGALIALLARAMAPLETPPSPNGASVEVDAPLPPELADSMLFLRLVPQLGPNGEVLHAASLHGSASEAAPVGAVAGSVFALRIGPVPDRTPEGHLAIAYDVTISPLRQAAPEPNAPYGHRVDSDEARRAAQAVLEAPPGERRARLVELVEALVR